MYICLLNHLQGCHVGNLPCRKLLLFEIVPCQMYLVVNQNSLIKQLVKNVSQTLVFDTFSTPSKYKYFQKIEYF